MATSTYLLALFALLLTYGGTNAEEEDLLGRPKRCKPCNLAYKCSSEINPFFAIDGKACVVLRNSCHFSAENCSRRRDGRCDPLLKATTQGKCQRLCRSTVCPTDYTPLCGSQSDTDKRTFSNDCEMRKYNCRNVTFYTLFLPGECP